MAERFKLRWSISPKWGCPQCRSAQLSEPDENNDVTCQNCGYSFDVDEAEMIAPQTIVERLIFEGLLVEGSHHKQYYLKQIAQALDIDLDKLRHEALRTNDREWDKGIAP